MKKQKYHHSFDRIVFANRWKFSKYRGLMIDMASDWTIIGIAERWFSPTEYEYILAFFGFEMRIWIKREWR